MSSLSSRSVVLFLTAALMLIPLSAHASISGANGDNVQSGRNTADSNQSGSATVGQAIGGQQIDVQAGGDANVKATNTGEFVNLRTGHADAGNELAGFVGQSTATDTTVTSSAISGATANNLQDGDNSLEYDQSADASTGDAIGGQVIGVTAGRDASVTANNNTRYVRAHTGNADAGNDAGAFVGLATTTSSTVVTSAIVNVTGSNVQSGENSLNGDQDAFADTGSANVGQDLTVHAGRDAWVDATNAPDHVSASSGNADTGNDSASFVGLVTASATIVGAGLVNTNGSNLQEGENELRLDQLGDGVTGDTLTGQRADITAGRNVTANLHELGSHKFASPGDSSTSQNQSLFVGLVTATGTLAIGP